jgi:hypothetical protein
MPMISEVDVQYNTTTSLRYDPKLERFVTTRQVYEGRDPAISRTLTRLGTIISSAFLPEGVKESYYPYMRWRILQRFVNANLNVIGTQSLLLALGIKSRSSLGLSAALNWVLKDALGKIARMLWASKMGRRFDSDAKRWRFRAAFLFAFGNYLEIVTYIHPQLFLLYATTANCFKQVAMLTSSSTRTAIYNSFRDGTRENIGDITAKGEAQIATVDLFGIASGVYLSRAVGTSVSSVLGLYVALQALEIVFMYSEIRSVQFSVLNFERLVQIIEGFCHSQINNSTQSSPTILPTPEEMSSTGERIFLPPKRLARRALAFGSLGRARLAPTELSSLMDMFQNERFLLVVGANTKRRRWFGCRQRTYEEEMKENCHVVLHVDATNMDIVKSTLALSLLREKLAASEKRAGVRTSDCWDIIEEAGKQADRLFPVLLRQMSDQGWAPPARFMFGRVHSRAKWPLRSL